MTQKDDKAQEKGDKKEAGKEAGKNESATNATDKAKRYVHLIPHSHTSEGFLSTSENYYSGADSNTVYIGGVRDILDSVIDEMI